MTIPSTGGRAVVRALVERDVDLVFGIPGTHNLEIYRHLADSGIRHVTPRHEQGGGYAADAYARVSGKPGVVVTTTGPGLTNAITAAATSYADSLPVLLISPGMPTGMERIDVGWLHEMKDQHAAIDAVVERSVRVTSAAEAYAAIHDAFDRWAVGRRRPVHIEVPIDVLDGEYDDASLVRPENAFTRPTPDAASVAAAADALAGAGSTMMVVGGGARLATEEVREVAERLGAPVVTTVNGKGILPEDHPLSLGASIRLAEAHTLLTEADALLVVGSVLGDDELWGNVVRASGVVVRLDVDPAQLDKNLTATHHLHGDAGESLRLLLAALPLEVPNALRDKAAELRANLDAAAMVSGAPFAPFHEALAKVLPPTTIFSGDSAQVSYNGTASQWTSLRPGQFVYPAGFATLGYGIPGGIGAALASPGTPVVVVAGDGGTMFTIQEFATAVDLGMPLPVVVFNNAGFQEIREGMQARGIDPLGVDVRSPDFPLLGQAFGGEGRRVHTPAELAEAVADALQASTPTLIEVPI
jgi:acetolactate synthase-1/2/3 large subunit